MKIITSPNLTQQAYQLVQALKDESPVLSYWVIEREEEVKAAVYAFNEFSDLFHSKMTAVALDPGNEASISHYGALLEGKKHVYIVAKSQFDQTKRILSLLKQKQQVIVDNLGKSPQQIKKLLVGLGYDGHGEERFSFSAKGEQIVLNHGEKRYKILFDEDGIESIKDENQEALKELSLFPLELDIKELPEIDLELPKGILIQADHLSKKGLPKDWETIELLTLQETPALEKPASYKRDFKALSKELFRLQEKNYRIICSVIDPDVLKTALEETLVDKIELLQQAGPIEGIIDTEKKVAFFSHAEIFGRKQVKERKRRDDKAFVTKLAVNDYVVHEDHGVARYLGLVESEIEGHTRENLLLEYAKADKLYVPVEMAYKVDKYIGESKPKLQRLSGTSWVRLSKKATQDAQDFAKKLLALYAKRSISKMKPWMVFKDADKKMHETFEYTETPDQELAIPDVYNDLAKDEPMDRLVVGDVGFGKTEVAIRATYQAVLNHKQVAVLCPTTLLAQQHYDTFAKRLKELGVRVEMLSRFTGKIGKNSTSIKKVVELLNAGEVDVVIGTHRLLSKDINFKDIGLIIIDEEQRFGVKHKEALKKLRSQTHILTLSATPIPRTLYFSLSGLRDISTIQTPPEGRQEIDTSIEPNNNARIKEAIEAELKRGGQAFYLYNHVQTITTAKKRLQELLGAHVKIGIAHGQMPAEEMARVAHDFDAGKIDVLVCSTIIENGIDIPNVNTLIVHNATRFGLGQLYQIRGRIGRGKVKAHALFLYPEEGITGVAARRLQILQEAKALGSGFQLAMRDLEMRGMGQMLGKNQHGHVQKVGLNMYGKLLNQAVEEIETGHVTHKKKAITINLPLDYGVPEGLVKDSEERVKLYREISQAGNIKDVEESLYEYDAKNLEKAEREKLDNLLEILELRFLAEKTPVVSIDYQEVEKIDGIKRSQLEIGFTEINPGIVDKLYEVLDDFKIVENRIVAEVEEKDALGVSKKVLGKVQKKENPAIQ